MAGVVRSLQIYDIIAVVTSAYIFGSINSFHIFTGFLLEYCFFDGVPVQSSLLPPFKLDCYESPLHNLNAYFFQICDLQIFFLGLWLLIFLVSFKEQNFLTIK